MSERFVNGLIGVLEIDVFADDRDLDRFFGRDDALDEFAPVRQIGLRRLQTEKFANEFVQSFGVKHQRHFVNACARRRALRSPLPANVAKHRKFLAQFGIEWLFGPANQHLRLQTDLAQLGDALLGRLGL